MFLQCQDPTFLVIPTEKIPNHICWHFQKIGDQLSQHKKEQTILIIAQLIRAAESKVRH